MLQDDSNYNILKLSTYHILWDYRVSQEKSLKYHYRETQETSL